MQSLHLKKADWKNVLDHISRAPKTQRASLQITIGDVDSQPTNESLVFEGMTFDPTIEVLVVRVGGVAHIIHGPLDVEITYSANDIRRLNIHATPNVRYMATFLPPLHLPELLFSYFPVRS